MIKENQFMSLFENWVLDFENFVRAERKSQAQ